MIVFCHLLNDRSGSPRVLRGAIAALDGSGQTNLLFVGSQGRGFLEDTKARLQRYWYKRSRYRIVTLLNLVVSQIWLYRSLSRSKEISSDAIIYMNTLLPFGAALWARLNSRRLICHVHEVSLSPAPLRWFLTTVAARTADLLIYVSHDHLQRLPINAGRALVLANPVDPDLQEKGWATPYSPRRSGLFEVLMLASARDFKGLPEFLGLARALSARTDIAFKLVLNADAGEIRHYLDVQAVGANVRVHSRTDNPAIFYSTADLVVNLSRVDLWVETFGLTLAEAMSFGIPIIAPPVGGPAEMVVDGIEGFLIDSREGAALAAAVAGLADDAALCLAMSAAGRRRAAQFSHAAFARSLQGHVKALQNGVQRS